MQGRRSIKIIQFESVKLTDHSDTHISHFKNLTRGRTIDTFAGNHQNCDGQCSKVGIREFFNPDYADEAASAAEAVQQFVTSEDFMRGLLFSGSTSVLEAYHSSLIHLNLLGTFRYSCL